MNDIMPVLENEEMWTSRVIDDQYRKAMLNDAQLMWIDVISAIISQPSFNINVGDMSYVFKNMIAKFVSSADFYKVSKAVYEQIISKNDELYKIIKSDQRVNIKKYFYGKDKSTLLEHMIPTSVTARALLALGPSASKEDVSFILRNSGCVAIILREEDKLLPKSKMPENWQLGDSYYARYIEAGIEIQESCKVRRSNAILR
jgi:hypothetical protein